MKAFLCPDYGKIGISVNERDSARAAEGCPSIERKLISLSSANKKMVNFYIKLHVQRSGKWLVRGWVKFLPALA